MEDTLVARLRTRAGAEERFLELAGALVRETAGEPGAVDYELHRDGAGTFLFYERYVDGAAMAAHLASSHLTSFLREVEPLLDGAPELARYTRLDGVGAGTAVLEGGARAVVYVAPLGKASFVVARAPGGVVGCGALDVAPLQRLGIAAARVKPTRGPSIRDGADLLAGEVREANELAAARGVTAGMSGAEALRRLS